jgi:hypothetical protein
MLPATQTVPVGTTLKLSMSALTFEDHTATFGPGDPEHDPGSYLGKLAASFNSSVFAPEAVYPSEPPGERHPVAQQQLGNVHGAGHIHVLLPDPHLHEVHSRPAVGNDHRSDAVTVTCPWGLSSGH